MSFKRFDPQDIVISAESVTSPIWTGDNVTLGTFYSSSTQVAETGAYYLDVYNGTPTDSGSRVQFAIAYGHVSGSGSTISASQPPTKAVYGQFRTLVLGDEESSFSFGGQTSDHFYALVIDRARYKEKLLPGSLTLKLKNGTTEISLTDNSQVSSTVTYSDTGRVYEVLSGSMGTIATGTYSGSTVSGSYGKFLPDVGVILLNAKVLDLPTGSGGLALATNTSSTPITSSNNVKLFQAISGSASFRLQSEETVTSNYVYVRPRNAEFNYSMNPSMLTGSGELRHSVLINSPRTYITTVGLYNDNNELLAVAKLSRPLIKDFTKEALIRVKLDF